MEKDHVVQKTSPHLLVFSRRSPPFFQVVHVTVSAFFTSEIQRELRFCRGQNKVCFTYVDNYCHGLILGERALYQASENVGRTCCISCFGIRRRKGKKTQRKKHSVETLTFETAERITLFSGKPRHL